MSGDLTVWRDHLRGHGWEWGLVYGDARGPGWIGCTKCKPTRRMLVDSEGRCPHSQTHGNGDTGGAS